MRTLPPFSLYFAIVWIVIIANGSVACKQKTPVVRVAITTSMEPLQCLETLANAVAQKTGIHVQQLVLPSAQALESLVRGDISAAFAHAPEIERRFRQKHPSLTPVITLISTFVITGPLSDPAGVRRAQSPEDAFARIARTGVPFVSRNDASGTAEFERKTWKKSGVVPAASQLLETGRGTMETLFVAAEKNAYTLTPLAAWLSFSTSPSYQYDDYGPLFTNTTMMPNSYTLYITCRDRNPDSCQHTQVLANFFTTETAIQIVKSFSIGGVLVFHDVVIP